MKSIQTKFIVLILGCILLSSSVIGGAGTTGAGANAHGSIAEQQVAHEDSVKIMNLMCKEKNRKSMRCLENPAIGQDAGGLRPLQSRIYAADIGLVLKQNDA